MEREAPAVRLEGRQRRPAAHVRNPRAGLDPCGDLGDRAVRHAEQHDVRVVLGLHEAACGEPRAHGASDAPPRPYDFDVLDHSRSSSWRIPGTQRVLERTAVARLAVGIDPSTSL
jgi:hypothetical protein